MCECKSVASNLARRFGATVLCGRSMRHEMCEDWGGRRGLNPRHSVPQTDALPAELLPPLTDNKQFTLLFGQCKRGSMGQSRPILLPIREGIEAKTRERYCGRRCV